MRQEPAHHRRARMWSGAELHRPVPLLFPVRRVPPQRFSTESQSSSRLRFVSAGVYFHLPAHGYVPESLQITPDNPHFCTQLFNFSLRFLVQTLGFRNGGTLDFIVKGLIDHPGHIRRRFALWCFCRRGFLQVHLGYHPVPAPPAPIPSTSAINRAS